MKKSLSLPVTLLCILMFAFSALHAKDNITTDDDLSEFSTALKLSPDIDNGRELYKKCLA